MVVNRSHPLIYRLASLLALAIASPFVGVFANEGETTAILTLYHDEAKLDVAVTGVFDQSGMAEATVIETIRPDSLSVIDPSGQALTHRIKLSEDAGDLVLGALKGQSARLNRRSKLFSEVDAEDNAGTIVQDRPILFQRGNEIFKSLWMSWCLNWVHTSPRPVLRLAAVSLMRPLTWDSNMNYRGSAGVRYTSSFSIPSMVKLNFKREQWSAIRRRPPLLSVRCT